MSVRIKIGKGDPAVEEWLAAQKSRSGSVQLLIKAFAYMHGNVDITRLGFDELLGGGPARAGKAESAEPEKAEEKRQEVHENSTMNESEEEKGYEETIREEINEKKKNMLMSMM